MSFISGTCEKESIEGYPTFKFYTGDKFLKEYDGGRDEKDFLNFVKNSPAKEEL